MARGDGRQILSRRHHEVSRHHDGRAIVTWLQLLVHESTHRVVDDDGEVTIEYGILVVFVALALIAAAGVLSGSIDGWFDRIAAFVDALSAGG